MVSGEKSVKWGEHRTEVTEATEEKFGFMVSVRSEVNIKEEVGMGASSSTDF
jgi:hypothetical protein